MVFVVQRPIAAQRPAPMRVHATSVSELRQWDAYVTGRARDGQLHLRLADRDPSLPMRTIERFDQFHQGVRIWGADVVRDSERGIPVSIFGELAPDLSLAVEPSLAAGAAREALLGTGGNGAVLLREPELVIIRLASGDYRLAYTAVVAGGVKVAREFVDANSGAELLRYSEIQTQSVVATGRGVLGDTKKMSVVHEADTYFADDRMRPPVLRTFDMHGSLYHAINVLFGSQLFPSDRAANTTTQWQDSVAVDAHTNLGWTYDYYFKRHGRRGLDNRDRPITALINGVTQTGALQLPSDYADFAINAFWCGECGPGATGIMYFGNGIPAQYYVQGIGNIGYLAASLDVIAHELTHGITESTSGLLPEGEAGALNEAFSDIMGTSVEFYYQAPGAGVGQADYQIGEDSIRGPETPVNGIRSLSDPQSHLQGGITSPDHYALRYTGDLDEGGVHINAGIPGQAFYLAIEGGTNRTSGLRVDGVGAAKREQIEKVFYRAFTLLMPANATFATARATTIQAARDLYGAGSAVERAVTQAWTAVGVF
jgi:thermolysin